MQIGTDGNTDTRKELEKKMKMRRPRGPMLAVGPPRGSIPAIME